MHMFLLAHFPSTNLMFWSVLLSQHKKWEGDGKTNKLGKREHNKFSFFKCLSAALRLNAQDHLDGSISITVSLCLLLALLL